MEFNRVVGIDTFTVNFLGHSRAFLNIVDHGSNYQVTAYLGREFSSEGAWRGYSPTWLRFFGPPEQLISDGGSEFAGHFARKLEQSGTAHRVTDAD